MLELESQIRELVDRAATPVTLAELASRRPRRSRRRLVLAVAASVVVATVVTVVATRRDGAVRPSVSVPASTTTPNRGLTPDCTATATVESGCARTRADAEQILGIPLRAPTVMAPGWTLAEQTVVVYPPHFRGEHNDTDVPVYRQIWTPPGTDLRNDATPLLFGIRQRRVLPGESGEECLHFIGGHTQLADGTVICGTVPPILGTYGAKLVYGGDLHWVKDGVMYQVRDVGLPADRVLAILNSLH